jgi:AcrR family transcriptional regulator
LRDIKRERTKRALAETAVRLFLERGFDATSVEDICSEAEYSVSSFFRHFPTKEDVVFYDERDWMVRLRELVEHRGDQPVWDAIRDAVFERTVAFYDGDPEIARARLRLWIEVPALSRCYAEICVAWEEVIAGIFAEELGPDLGNDLYPQIAAGAILAAARAGVKKEVLEGGSVVKHIQAGLDLIEPALREPPAATTTQRRRRGAVR